MTAYFVLALWVPIVCIVVEPANRSRCHHALRITLVAVGTVDLLAQDGATAQAGEYAALGIRQIVGRRGAVSRSRLGGLQERLFVSAAISCGLSGLYCKNV
jgi:hypothetical protein